MPANALLAIDFGTSNTVAVLRQPGSADRPLLFGGSPVMPSAVYLDDDGRFHTGREAVRMAQLDPASFEPHPKQHVGEDLVLLGHRELPAVDLVAAVLARVRQAAVEVVGEAPPAVLTHPAQWGPHRIAVLERAAAAAGLDVARLVAEPVAAAYRFSQVEAVAATTGPIGVFDLGGGTFDIAVLRRDRSGRFAVAAQGGQTALGGVDLDQAIVAHLGALIEQRHPELWQRISRPETAADRRAHRQFRDDVREAKEMLSQSPMAPIALPGLDTALHLTRDEVDQLAAPLVEAAVALTGRVIGEAGCAPSDLAGLFLVGGASRMPLVGRVLHQRLQVPPTVLEQPELAVAQGALDAAEQPDEPEPEPEPYAPAAPQPPGDPNPAWPPPSGPAPDFGGIPEMTPVLPPPAPRRPTRASAFAAGLGAFLVLADFATMAVAMPWMGAELASGFAIELWAVVGGYALALAGLLPAAGFLADRWGLKRTYLVGLTGYAAATLVCLLAAGLDGIIVGSIGKGAAAAAVLAPAVALLNRTGSGRGRASVFGVWGAIGGAAAAFGGLLGGLPQLTGWRTIFLVEVLVAIAAIVLSAAVVAESRHTPDGRVDVRLLVRPGLAGPSLASLLMSAAAFTPLVYLSVWIYTAQWGAFTATATLLPLVAAALVTATALTRVFRRIAPWIGIGLGLALVGAGALAQSGMDAHHSWRSHVFGLVVTGIGVGLCVPSVNAAVTAGVPDERRIMAARALHVSVQAGLALGSAVLGAVFTLNLTGPGTYASALNTALLTAGWIALIGAVPAAFLVSRSRRPAAKQDEPSPVAS
ncbi:MFS transporter [Glycomyces harbinensis]|uniref:Major Facilitator Superfamily protein n=1 Tax=Glycomyces harbinensis TaxID=58114 RepID=A0A1G6SH19_9ACTN|nr:MFS transporter [Glycomyces harbinensis]SDD16230.1 Major Facilitator Superfamily protein [Glycomyces harbinensis]